MAIETFGLYISNKNIQFMVLAEPKEMQGLDFLRDQQ